MNRKLLPTGYMLVALIGLLPLFNACEVKEGVGGSGMITGTLMLQQYNDDFSLLIDQSPAKDEEVFIAYGNSQAVGDKVNTSRTGYFEFPYLYEGDYTVYYYTKDSLSDGYDKVEKVISISLSKNETLNLGQLNKLSILDYDEGLARIKGVVRVVNYRNSSQWPHLIVKDTTFAQEQEIYLTYQNHDFYDDRIRTQEDGTFYFNNLIPGNYKIVLYSEDVTGASQKIPIVKNVTIESKRDTVIDLGTTLIYKL